MPKPVDIAEDGVLSPGNPLAGASAEGTAPVSSGSTSQVDGAGSGNKLNPIEQSMFVSEVAESLRTVYDPEIPVNVYDLGLIYDIQVDEAKNVHIVMTLTSPACPVAGSLPGEVEMAAMEVPGIGRVDVELTWDPPFTIESIPYETRVLLGLD